MWKWRFCYWRVRCLAAPALLGKETILPGVRDEGAGRSAGGYRPVADMPQMPLAGAGGKPILRPMRDKIVLIYTSPLYYVDFCGII